MAWTDNGPVSLPPRSLAYSVAGVAVVLALVGGYLGFRASFRDTGAPTLGARAGAGQAEDQTVAAQPIVELPAAPPPPAAVSNRAVANAADNDDQADDSNAIAAQTAAAQAVQAKPSKSAGDIDDILTSPSEKPQAPVAPPADEAPPADSKTDVPF